ncbi:uncharacterized protein DUF1194 [Breoghania corrubedonensis]|uniref:Uncharacterized protein DUF1194 n=1 Tax=Breoghania corrubedonensis TaxID=665038 RepID=A0A2T5VFI2_9HYPH|nr:DUF1194 domain-containing protein [Breoghania corrubedonensis]PTW62513.1 uncharacterized protein DUF1194 [Breoghania corrubedonensis]
MRLARFLVPIFGLICLFCDGSARLQAREIVPGEEIDLALVLAVDISYSMDQDEQRLQRMGYISAITAPEVLKAISGGLTGKIAVAYVEWAGTNSQFTLVDWHKISDRQSAEEFAAALAEAPMQRAYRTSISGGLTYARNALEKLDAHALRRVIDISGDGPNNQGEPVLDVREAVVSAGIVINGLPLVLKRGPAGWYDIDNLDEYYERCVIGGAGAFSIPVRDINAFARAVRMKLVLEIAGMHEPQIVQKTAFSKEDQEFCLIGERIWHDRINDRDWNWR